MNCLDAAKEYLSQGFTPIPCKGKIASVPWRIYQTQRPEGLDGWFTNGVNVALVTGKLSNLTVIDIDTFDGGVKWDELCPEDNHPIVSTPGGGYHHYFKYCPELTNKVRVLPGIDVRSEGGIVVAPPSMGPNGLPYAWVKPLCPLPSVPEAFLKIARQQRGHAAPQSDGQTLDPGRRNEDLFHIVYTMALGGERSEKLKKIAFDLGRKGGLPDQEIRVTMESAIERATRRERNVASEVREWVEKTEGPFRMAQICKELGMLSVEEGNVVRSALHNLKMKLIVEPTGKMAGEYRLISKDCPVIKWMDAAIPSIPVTYAFGLEKLVDTYPRQISVIAGKSNAGKSAFMLDFVKRNMERYEINYFSSEMGASEMRRRIGKHLDIAPKEWKFNAYEKARDIADVIKPNEINIVDFLEVMDGEFYKIGSYITQIWNRLGDGIALLALQKKGNQEVGRGGDMTLEKARLYLSMDDDKVKIVKAKNWATETNPNGLTRYFHIEGGWKFVYDSEWLNRDDVTAREQVEKTDLSPKNKATLHKLIRGETK